MGGMKTDIVVYW